MEIFAKIQMVITPDIKHIFFYRLHEFDEQIKAVRDGMSKVVPVPLLSLFSGYELETMVCGSPDIPLNLLKSVATYKGNQLLPKTISN